MTKIARRTRRRGGDIIDIESDPYDTLESKVSAPITPASDVPVSVLDKSIMVGGLKRTKRRRSLAKRKSRRRSGLVGSKPKQRRSRRLTKKRKGGAPSWSKTSSDVIFSAETPTGIRETNRIQNYNVGLPKYMHNAV